MVIVMDEPPLLDVQLSVPDTDFEGEERKSAVNAVQVRLPPPWTGPLKGELNETLPSFGTVNVEGTVDGPPQVDGIVIVPLNTPEELIVPVHGYVQMTPRPAALET